MRVLERPTTRWMVGASLAVLGSLVVARAEVSPQSVSEQIDRLRAAEDAAGRAAASEALGAMGAAAEPAVPWLVADMEDDRTVVSPTYGETTVATVIGKALVQIGPAALTAVKAQLSATTSTPVERGNAAYALAVIHDATAVDALVQSVPFAYQSSDTEGRFGWKLVLALECMSPDPKVPEAYLKLHAAATAAGSGDAIQIDHRFFTVVGQPDLSGLDNPAAVGAQRTKALEDWWTANKSTATLQSIKCAVTM